MKRLTAIIATLAAAATCWALVPREPVIEDLVEVVEINHVYDENGCKQLQQVIGWDDGQVSWWRMYKDKHAPHGKTLIFTDGHYLRKIRAGAIHETHLQYDPEVNDREKLSTHMRKGLSK